MNSLRFLLRAAPFLIGLSFQPLLAQVGPLWLRYPAVSPDGKQIAFCYQGQIWLVKSEGGDGIPLTGSHFYCTNPVWSPDGSRIAFASTRHGNEDVFVMPAEGGEIQRLTYHSAQDVPMAFSTDGKEVVFSSARLGSPSAVAQDSTRGLGAKYCKQVYTVPASGGRTHMLLPIWVSGISWDADGSRFLYDYATGQLENEWRKHQASDSSRDIWIFDTAGKTHRKLTEWRGEDRNPVWSADGKSMLWLSEESGSLNIWRRPLEGGEKEQVSRHSKWPVRFLSTAKDGTLVYAWNGEIWRKPADGGDAEVVPVRIVRGNLVGGNTVVNINSQVSEFTVSSDGTQVALVARGEVFVVSVADGETRRITSTPAMERNVDFSPDGRRLLYASERGGDWDIVEAKLTDEEDKSFGGAAPFEETVIIDGDDDTYRPLYSPQGDRIAYLHERTAIRVYDIATGDSIEVQPKGAAYSYYDNDMLFKWSPDGKWLLTQTGFGEEIGLADASGKAALQNVSLNGFSDSNPKVSSDGQIAYWLSDREGLRTAHFSGVQSDVFAAFLTPEALEKFQNGEAPKEQAGDEEKKEEKEAAPYPSVDGLERRTARLTPFSGAIAFFRLSPDNKRLIVVYAQPSGTSVCYAIDTTSRAMRTVFTGAPLPPEAYAADAKLTSLFVAAGGSLTKYDLASGTPSPIPFQAEMVRNAPAETRALFEHCWRLTDRTFYVPDMQGVDWKAVGDHYRRFLPHIIHWEDLSQLLEEMVGELNASHQGDPYLGSSETDDRTATLGLYYDDSYTGAGMKIAKILPGGPADRPSSHLKPGATILAVDGEEITPDMGIEQLMNRKGGTKVLLMVQPAGGGEPVEERVTPIDFESDENSLAYESWIASRRALVSELSKGRIGYIHVPHMNLAYYQRAYGDTFGRYRDAEALIVDVRSNGGGNLHDQLITLLTGHHDSSNVSRDGLEIARNPGSRWAKPSAVVINGNSYSDGSVFPMLYKRKGIGPLIGERTPGTGTAVVRDPLIDPHMTHGVPELGFQLTDGTWFENQDIVADVLIYNDPESVAAGKDLQIEAAVTKVLEMLDKK